MTLIFEPFGPLYELSGLRRQRTAATRAGPFAAPADMIADDEAITLLMDVPGLKAGDIEIELDGNRLTVRGERRPPYGDDGPPQRAERSFGAFERTLRLPAEIDADAIEGRIARGVLTLRIPLSKQPQNAAGRVDVRDQQPEQQPGPGQSEPEPASRAS